MLKLVGSSAVAVATLVALASCADSVAAPPNGQAAPPAPTLTLRGTCTTTQTAFYTRYDYGTPRSTRSDIEIAVQLDDSKTAIATVLSATASHLPSDLWASAQLSHQDGALTLTVDKTVEIGRDTVYDTSFMREQYTCSLSALTTSAPASVARLGS